MKEKVNNFIDWFESHFNIIIDLLALIGGAFCIFLGIFVFIVSFFDDMIFLERIENILVPGVLGFFGIIILFALRITRKLSE